MLLKVLSRVAAFVGSLFVGSVLIFLMMNILPGNPAQVAAGVNATPQSVQALEVKFGLDRPLFVQYFDWAGHLFRGDFGISYISNYNITSEVIDKFQNTLYLLIGGIVVALVIAIPLGVLMAARNGKSSGLALSVVSQIGISIPAFALAIIL
ncbi:MAG: ABC transporter permease, partial [Antricoccus sp.]